MIRENEMSGGINNLRIPFSWIKNKNSLRIRYCEKIEY